LAPDTDRHRRGKIRRTKIEPVVKPHHVFDRIDGHAALADFPEDAVRVAVDSIKCRAVERGAQSFRALMGAEKMKTLICVLGQHQTREQPRRLFRFRISDHARPARTGFRILLSGFRCPVSAFGQIHLAIGAIQKRKLAGQSFAEQITRNLARLIDLRQRQTRQRQTGRCMRDRRF